MYLRTDPDDATSTDSARWAMVGSYPPTACGIATFGRSLVTALAGRGTPVDVVRAVDPGHSWAAPGVRHGFVAGDHPGAVAARLNGYDTVVVQHEYGIYGGADGSDLIALLDRLTVPVMTVLHTVLTEPTAHQRAVLRSVINASDLLVTMTRTARTRLIDIYHVDPATVLVIPHGAADQLVRGAASATTADAAPARRPVVLTWGLLGQGKGIEWGIDAMASLRDLAPRPVYLVAGQTHPRVLASEGEAYRHRLESRARTLGVEDDVRFDNDYLDAARLHDLVHAADVVLLPYDSRDQVTSGVLSEAVAAGRPVVSTRFPHAVELLGGGMGLLVDQRDPAGIASALRRILTEPGLAARLSGRTQALAPALSWHAVAGTYLAAGESISRQPLPVFARAPAPILTASARLASATVPA